MQLEPRHFQRNYGQAGMPCWGADAPQAKVGNAKFYGARPGLFAAYLGEPIECHFDVGDRKRP